MATSFFQWLTNSALASAMNNHEWAFPIVQSFHFIGFALSIGTIAIVDFRLLGLGMRRQNASEIARDLNPWTLAGLAHLLITGPLIFSTDAHTYPYKSSFQFQNNGLSLSPPFL